MPEHRVPKDSLHEDLRAIEHDGERVVSIVPADDTHYKVTTVYVGQPMETRTETATVETRVTHS